MFPFDSSALPQITARRAFIGVDFQRGFTSPTGSLAVTEPEGYVQRACDLAAAFRAASCDVVWVRSEFDGTRHIEADQIVVSDDPSSVASPAPDPIPGRGGRAPRRTPVPPPESPTPTKSPDMEAFLSHEIPSWLTNEGSDYSPDIADQMAKSDITLTKTNYSAFKDTQLLHVLRAKMVMEVFICGSLANVGVFATAMDAAGHGLTITVVEDCCGFRREIRQRHAVQALIQFTGCEIASAKEVLDIIQPPPPAPRKGQHSKPVTQTEGNASVAGRASNSPDIVRPMTGLKLASASPTPIDHDPVDSVGATGDSTNGSKEPALPTDAAQPPDATGLHLDPSPALINAEMGMQPDLGLEPIAIGLDSASELQSPAALIKAELSQSATGAQPSSDKEGSISSSVHDVKDEDRDMSQKGLCEGDTDVITDLLPKHLEQGIFERLRDEIKWQRMSHQGGDVPRLVAVQGQVASSGSIPVYRHPSDESPPLLPFSPTVLEIKDITETHLGHTLNHVLVQYYRDGNDYISEHSDKTLDIARGSYIANVSLGAERTMVLRTKRLDKDPSQISTVTASKDSPKRTIHRARLPHNSLCRMGLKTNMKWLHSIRQDKRADRDKSPAELAFGGGRISLTFRQIETFLSQDEVLIWGQGASAKTCEDARAVVNGQGPEAVKMLKAFGTENHASNFDWDAHYGKGFDVLHMSTSPRFFASRDSIVNMRVSLMLAELRINYAKGSMGPTKDGETVDIDSLPIKFVDNDDTKSTVQGDVAILLYLEASYGYANNPQKDMGQPAAIAKRYTRFQQALSLHRKLHQEKVFANDTLDSPSVGRLLRIWDDYAAETDNVFLGGSEPSLPDFVIWPVLHSLVERHGLKVLDNLTGLKKYYEVFGAQRCVKKVLGVVPESGLREVALQGDDASLDRAGRG